MKKKVLIILTVPGIVFGIVCFFLAASALFSSFLPGFFVFVSAGSLFLFVSAVFRAVSQKERIGSAVLKTLFVMMIIAGLICLFVAALAPVPHLFPRNFFAFLSAGMILLLVPACFAFRQEEKKDVVWVILRVLEIVAVLTCFFGAVIAFSSHRLWPYFFIFLSAGILLLAAPSAFREIRRSVLEKKHGSDAARSDIAGGKTPKEETLFPEETPPEPAEVVPVPGYQPQQFDFHFTRSDFDELEKIKSIRVDSGELSCSLINKQPLSVTLRIGQTEYVYCVKEEYAANDGYYSFLHSVTLNDEPFYLYFCEIPGKCATIGFRLSYTRSGIVYENMKQGQRPDSALCRPHLKSIGYCVGLSVPEMIPYIITAVSLRKSIHCEGEGHCIE